MRQRLTAVVLFLCLLSGCGAAGTGSGTPTKAANPGGAEKLRVVTTTFPLYDWTRHILGEQAGETDLILLQDSGVDLHSFQPSVEDMASVAACDLFVYVGGTSDDWTRDALRETANPGRVSVNLLNVLGDSAKSEETVEGMQEDAEEAAEEYDEHVWLSLRNAAVFCGAIADALTELDPDHAVLYADNCAAYQAELSELDSAYQSAVDGAKIRTVLFADRFPFRYLTDDYGLTYYAAFSGCSAETEASFETVVFLSGKVDELSLPAVLTIETGDGKIARTVVENTENKDAEILTLNSLQSVTAADAADGADYLTIMRQNLDVLREALGAA